jgi:hypothetical protein
MEGLFRFLHILAWLGMILYFLRAIAQRIMEVRYYRNMQFLKDLYYGRVLKYDWITPLVISILCGIWLFAFNQFDPLFVWLFR